MRCLRWVALTLLAATPAAASACPAAMTMLETVHVDGVGYTVCEDLQDPGGGIAMVPDDDATDDGRSSGEYWPKTHEPYAQGTDDEYYLGLGKDAALQANWDILADAMLNNCSGDDKSPTTGLCEPSWERARRAIPVIRYSRGNPDASGNAFTCSPYSTESGVRTFTGSRSASVDATFSDHADDCTDNGFPKPQGYVMNLTAIANGEPPIHDFLKYVNFSAMAEGLVGGHKGEPNLVFYFNILPQNGSSYAKRYWTMVASPVPDMEGSREQSVWFRFQQIVCSSSSSSSSSSCRLHGRPQYYDTYWYSYSPITTRWIRPELQANATGFYANLLRVRRFWEKDLAAENMMQLSLPDTAGSSNGTNGTWLAHQATFSIVRSMISRDNTWHSRYGVQPGYGISLQDGFQDTFTSTATAALEVGAFPYARGVIDNWLKYYVRNNGMVSYRAEELAQTGRMMTIFALYYDYTGDAELLLAHFSKIKIFAEWHLYRYESSLHDYPATSDDPRRGIVAGLDEGDTFVGYYESYGNKTLPHLYSGAINVYRGILELGRVWEKIAAKGAGSMSEEIAKHAKELSSVAPAMLEQIQSSLDQTTYATGNPLAPRCVPSGADPTKPLPEGAKGDFRGFNEMAFGGVLTSRQLDDVWRHLAYGNETNSTQKPMTMSCTGYNAKCSTYTAYGMAYGLLQHDMVERALVHMQMLTLHTYTRGTWTTPEARGADPSVGSTDYVAAGVHTAPIYLKWMLVFEEPNTRTVWLAKATPRDWLGVAAATTPVEVSGATTRYGRVGFRMQRVQQTNSSSGGGCAVLASISLPDSYASAETQPSGGVRFRLRAPVEHAGKMSAVTLGGGKTKWTDFDAKAETVNFAAKALTPELIAQLGDIRVEWSASAVTLGGGQTKWTDFDAKAVTVNFAAKALTPELIV